MSVKISHNQTHSDKWVFSFSFLRKKQTIELTYDVTFSSQGNFDIFKGPIEIEFDFDALVKRVEVHVGFELTKDEAREVKAYFKSVLPKKIVVK